LPSLFSYLLRKRPTRHRAITVALREGQKRKVMRNDVDSDEAATFLIATYEGYLSLAKNWQDVRVLRSGQRS
jgi:TetR/AcrR family transcriptional repressor of nem operon